MDEFKTRLSLLNLDLRKLERRIREDPNYGTVQDWEHVLKEARRIEEFAAGQIAIRKYMKG
jgi:hypothetical protein